MSRGPTACDYITFYVFCTLLLLTGALDWFGVGGTTGGDILNVIFIVVGGGAMFLVIAGFMIEAIQKWYTKRQIKYVYNELSSNFKPFGIRETRGDFSIVTDEI